MDLPITHKAFAGRGLVLRTAGLFKGPLHTREREEADRLGRQLLVALLSGETRQVGSGKVTLKQLWERFKNEAPNFLDNHPRTKDEAEARAKVLIAFFGEDCDVRHFTARDQAAYTTQRIAGGIRYAKGRETPKVRARSVEPDLVLLHAMLSWATTVRVPGGGRLLEHNPLSGVRRVRELQSKAAGRNVGTVFKLLAPRCRLWGQQRNPRPSVHGGRGWSSLSY